MRPPPGDEGEATLKRRRFDGAMTDVEWTQVIYGSGLAGGGRCFQVVKIRRPQSGQQGQGMVEYALILVLVSIVVILILLTMGGQIANVFSNVVVALNT
jgi:pilus assembly protein Flp/PilA